MEPYSIEAVVLKNVRKLFNVSYTTVASRLQASELSYNVK